MVDKKRVITLIWEWSRWCRCWYQARGAYFKPYIDFLCWQAKVASVSRNPDGWCMWTSYSRSPFKKVLLMSTCCTSHFQVISSVSMILIVVGFTTGEKVSWKSNPCCWRKPLATRHYLYLLMIPSTFSFTLKSVLASYWLPFSGKVGRTRVPFIISDSYSVFIAWNHSGWVKACFAVVSFEWTMNDLGLDFSVLALVGMGWSLARSEAWLIWVWNDGESDSDILVP